MGLRIPQVRYQGPAHQAGHLEHRDNPEEEFDQGCPNRYPPNGPGQWHTNSDPSLQGSSWKRSRPTDKSLRLSHLSSSRTSCAESVATSRSQSCLRLSLATVSTLGLSWRLPPG